MAKETFAEVIQTGFRGYAGGSETAEDGSDEMASVVFHANRAITEWERLVREGIQWPELRDEASVVCAGSGSDDHELDFLDFFREPDGHAGVMVDGVLYTVVSASTGKRLERIGTASGHHAWIEGPKLRTYPAATGTAEFSYLKKATRVVTGSETTEPEMSDPSMISEYITGMLFASDGDDTSVQTGSIHIAAANDALRMMKIPYYPATMAEDTESGWGIGM